MNILIAGIAGVIGKELSRLLLSQGHKIIGIDKKEFAEDADDILFIQKDINDLKQFEINALEFDVVINLAASFERTEESLEFYDINFKDNLCCSHHLLELVLNKGISQYIFASSYLVYDESQYLSSSKKNSVTTLNESSKIFPRNLIGSSKLLHETEVNSLSKFFQETKFVNLRIFRGIGLGSNCVISRWVRAALNNDGIDLYNKEGSFDYIFSKDSAFGIAEAVNNNLSGTYNLGTGKSRYVSDIVEHLKFRFPNLEINDHGDMGNFENSQADISAFVDATDYTPSFSLEKAIDEIIEFEKGCLNSKSDKQKYTVLVTSSGNKTPLMLSAKRWAKYRESKIIGGDSNPNVLSNFLFDDFIQLPFSEDDYLKEILDLLKLNDINSVLPTRDGELEFWSKHKKFFNNEGIKVIISDYQTILKCLDKYEFYKFCHQNSIQCIDTFLNPCDPPYISKPRYGSGSEDLKIFHSANEQSNLNQPNYIFQPFIEGIEYSFDALSDMNGSFACGIIRERKLTIDGESKITTQIDNQVLKDNCIELLNKLKIQGPSITQFFVTKEQEQFFIEVNPRVGGGYTSIINSGLLFWDFICNPTKFDPDRLWIFKKPILGSLQRFQADEFSSNF